MSRNLARETVHILLLSSLGAYVHIPLIRTKVCITGTSADSATMLCTKGSTLNPLRFHGITIAHAKVKTGADVSSAQAFASANP